MSHGARRVSSMARLLRLPATYRQLQQGVTCCLERASMGARQSHISSVGGDAVPSNSIATEATNPSGEEEVWRDAPSGVDQDITWRQNQPISFRISTENAWNFRRNGDDADRRASSTSDFRSLRSETSTSSGLPVSSVSAEAQQLVYHEDNSPTDRVLPGVDDSKPLEGRADPPILKPPTEESLCTPLGFHIPKTKLQTALDAAPDSISAYWQYTLYRGPGGDKDTVKVHYCKNKEASEKIAQLFMDEEVIGFDIEWKANASVDDGIKKNVALVQIASERRVALFHIARFPNANTADDFVAPSLKKIMESSEITKVGVSIKGDCTRLKKFLCIESRGLFELSHLYKLVKYSAEDVKKVNKILVSLASQVQEHLQLPLWKGGEVRSSDWSADLNYQQIQYAASDSYAGFHLYHKLEAKRKAMDPMPPRPAHAELNLPIKLANGQTVAAVEEAPMASEDQGEDAVTYPDISVEEILRDFPKFEFNDAPTIEAEVASSDPTKSPPDPKSSTNTTKTTSTSGAKPISLPQSPELSQANTWISQYTPTRDPLSPTKKLYARTAELRAYALWHEQNLEVPAIASLLRDPPLQNSTVVNYIVRAVLLDGLPYRRERVGEMEKFGVAYGVSSATWDGLKKGRGSVGDKTGEVVR